MVESKKLVHTHNTIGKITNPRKKIRLGSKKRYAAVVSFLTNTRLRFDGFTADFKENTTLSTTFWLKIPSSGIPVRRGFTYHLFSYYTSCLVTCRCICCSNELINCCLNISTASNLLKHIPPSCTSFCPA